MLEFLWTPLAQSVIWGAVAIGALAFGMWLVSAVRRWIERNSPEPIDLLTHFRAMHETGDVSETEFKRIKQVVGQLRQETRKCPVKQVMTTVSA